MAQYRKKFRLATIIPISALLLLGSLALPYQSWWGINFSPRVAEAYGVITPASQEGLVYAVSATNRLISFNSFTPGALHSNVAITGLQASESVVGIDFRPATGQLYALGLTGGNTGRLYTINLTSGAATQVGSTFTLPQSPGGIAAGSDYGFDFNPTVDRIRVVANSRDNFRLHPVTGAVAGADTALTAGATVTGAAYTNNYAAATSTTLYGIDAGTDQLVTIGGLNSNPSPNGGAVTAVGALGVNTTNDVGFDIFTLSSDTALASMQTSGATSSTLYSINLGTGAATQVGGIGISEIVRDIAIVPRVETIFALTAGNNLLSFISGAPGTIASTTAITGLGGGESLVGIDFRPATGVLYGLSNAGRVYTINTQTGQAFLVGSSGGPTLSGTAFGVDFNPVPDRIRVVSDADQNLRLNPNNGALASGDAALSYLTGDPNAGQNPNVVAAAYSNNIAGTATTTLYGIDSALDILVTQNPPNDGILNTRGALGVNTTNDAGFDIASQTGAAFASLTPNGSTTSSLYAINLTSGAATLIGAFGTAETIRDIAIPIRVETVFAVTNSNTLISFNSVTPGNITLTVPITGLGQGENIVGLDFRPATGQLFALSSASRLYTINPFSGGATPVASAITPAITGQVYGFDFNPVPDRIRVVTEADANLRLHPDTGAIAGTDTPLAYATGDPNAAANPNIVGVAYTNNVAGTAATTLFGIDSTLDILVRQGSPGGSPTTPNSGQLFTIGALGQNTNDVVGFDISDCTGTAYATLTTGAQTTSQFSTINLLTGAATIVGAVGVNEVILDFAVATNYLPSAAFTNGTLTVVNAASFTGDSIAPDEVISLFGNFQTTNGQGFSATTSPLPTSLGGISVNINGNVALPLFFVSNTQINAYVPTNVNDGAATITVTSLGSGVTRSALVNVTRSAPGVFTARANGTGAPAGLATFDGITYEALFNPDGTEREISAGSAARPNFLVLYATGFRRTPAINPNDGDGVAESVTATIQGVPATVTYAGPSGFLGVDQLNVQIPPQLAGTGIVKVRLFAGGKPSNVVTVRLGGSIPQVNYQTITSGQPLNGSLSTSDQVQINDRGLTYFFDAYQFTAAAGTSVAVSLNSATFDALVGIARVNNDGSLTYISSDDQNGGLGNGGDENDNALLLAVLPEAGTYAIVATSAESNPNATGVYSLTLRTGVIQAISYSPTPVSGIISLTDLQTSAGDFLDAYSFAASAGDTVQITMDSTAFDSFLILNANNGDLVNFDDNGNGGSNARITATLSTAGTYIIIATPFAPGRTGTYSLTLNRLGIPTSADLTEAIAADDSRNLPGPIEGEEPAHKSLSGRRVVPNEIREQ